MKIQKFFMLSLTALAVACFTSCKDDELSKVPSIPTTFEIKDGAVVSDTIVTLRASGSTAEDENVYIKYHYFWGTSKDNMEEINTSNGPAKINLTPYTQYYWYVQTSVDDILGEPSEIRTFYCVPPLNIETDNGDGEWATVLRFKNIKDIKGGKVIATPDHSGYEIDPIDIPAGQDSCYLKMTRYSVTENNACVQDFDDEHGKYYVPVIYNFDVSVDVQVGDKKFTVNNSAKNIILNKQAYVYDHEFNVYRTVEINGATWMIDDYRAKSYIDKDGNVIQMKEGEDYVTNTLPSGAVGYYYNAETASKFDVNKSVIGYKYPWNVIHSEMLESFDLTYREMFNYIASQYDWEGRPIPGNMSIFNARPFGYYTEKDGFMFVGKTAFYFHNRAVNHNTAIGETGLYLDGIGRLPTIVDGYDKANAYSIGEHAFILEQKDNIPYFTIRFLK